MYDFETMSNTHSVEYSDLRVLYRMAQYLTDPFI